jgi:hypothetical protein
LFEVEALRDGRLGGAERVSFERHMTGCAACAREAKALDGLGERLRAGGGDEDAGGAAVDELSVRRERTRLLAAFDHALVSPESGWSARTKRRAAGIAAFVVVATVAALVATKRTTYAPEGARLAAPAPVAVVRADGAAVWSKQIDGDAEKIILDRGALTVHVEHAPQGALGKKRVVVVLPDGELEDTGTTFRVAADGGRTTRVEVEEGSVVLRLGGRAPVRVAQGETWSAPREAAPAATSAIASASASVSASASASALAPASAIASASAFAPSSTTSSEFRAAIGALDRGEYRASADAFAAFLQKHPDDSRAEDASYMRVIALHRSGDAAATRTAAAEYLSRYPAGFRRAEVLPLAR